MPIIRGSLAILALSVVAACSSTPKSLVDLDAADKRFEAPRPGLGAVYIVREGYWTSSPVAVLVDRRRIDTLAYDNYLRVELPPGQHDIRAQSIDTGNHLAVTNVQVAAGEIRFVALSNAVFDGLFARSITELSARELSSGDGRAAVLSRTRAAPGAL